MRSLAKWGANGGCEPTLTDAALRLNGCFCCTRELNCNASGAIYIGALGLAADARAHHVATPAMVAAFGAGGAVFGPTWRLVDAGGWGLDSLLLLALGLLISSALVVLAGGAGPTEGAVGDVLPEEAAEAGGSSKTLARIWFTFAFGSFPGLMVLGLAAKMMDVAKTGLMIASLGLAGIAIGNTLGRLSVATLSRHFRLDHCLSGAMILAFTGLLLAIWQPGPMVLCVGLILIALGYGIVASSVPVLTRVAFGAQRFRRKLALVLTAWGVAGLVAPWAGGALYDQTGSFEGPLWCAVIMVILCAVTSRESGRNPRPARRL